MNYLRWLVLLLGLLSLSACLSPAKTPPICTYTLNKTSCVNCKGVSPYTILVTEPTVNAAYRTSAMLYSLAPFHLAAFARNRWAAPPAQMLKPLIVQSLRATCFFHAVIAAPSIASAQFRLDTQLIKLQQEFCTEPSQVRIVLQSTLINTKTNKVLFERRLESVRIAEEDDPYSGVIAANDATADVLRRLAGLCVRYIKK